MFGTFVQFLVTLTDTAFLTRISEVALDAAGTAALIYVTFFMVGVGISNGAQIIIARREGSGNYSAIGKLFKTEKIIEAFCLIKVPTRHKYNCAMKAWNPCAFAMGSYSFKPL